MHCYICFETINKKTSWGNLFELSNKKLCPYCEKQFERLSEFDRLCEKCMKPLNRKDELLCPDCQAWEKRFKRDPLERHVSIFQYNEFMKDVMTRFKYRGDYELVFVFENVLQKTFTKYFSENQLMITPIPLSKERYEERAFNQAEAIAGLLNREPTHLLKRTGTEKQAKKTRRERILSENPFQSKTVKKGTNILLIDDIYTTGTTLRQAALALKSNGAHKIYALTLIRS